MAETRTLEQVRREIETERELLAGAVGELRSSARIRPRLPVLAVGALAVGFVVAGGIGATMRLIFRRRREH